MSKLPAKEGRIDRLLTWPARSPGLSVGLALLICVVSLFSISDLKRDLRMEKMFPDGRAERIAFDEFEGIFGRDDVTAICVVELDGAPVLGANSIARIRSLTQGLTDLDYKGIPLVDAEGIVSLSDAPVARTPGDGTVEVGPLFDPETRAWDPVEAERLVSGNPALEGRLISRDRKLCGFWVPLDPGAEAALGGEKARLRFAEAIRTYFSKEGALKAGEVAWLDGRAITNHNTLLMMQADTRLFYPLAFGLMVLVLYVAFRRVLPALLAVVTVALSCVVTFGFMAACGIPMSLLSTTIPVMILVVCVGDAVHLLTRYEQERRKSGDARLALESALREVGRACFFTSATSAVAFGALSQSKFEMVRQLGIPIAFGVLVAYVLTFLLLPPLLSRWPGAAGGAARSVQALERPLAALSRVIARYPGRILIGFVLLLGADLALLPSLSRETRMLHDFDEDDPVLKTRIFLEKRMDGAIPLEILIDTGRDGGGHDPAVQRGLLALGESLRSERFRELGVLHALSSADYLADAYHTLYDRDPAKKGRLPDTSAGMAQIQALYWIGGTDPTTSYVDSVDAPRKLRLGLRIRNLYTTDFFRLTAEVEAEAKKHLPEGVTVQLTGASLMSQLIQDLLSSEMLRTVGTAIVAVMLLVLISFRSLRLTLMALVPNLLPLLLIAGCLVLTGTSLSLTTTMVFAIVFGISVDDTIHFVAGYAQRRDSPDAVEATIRETGSSLVLSSLALVLGFSVLLVSVFPPNRIFGAMVAGTVVFALLGDLVLLPALIVLWRRTFGKAKSAPPAELAPSGAPIGSALGAEESAGEVAEPEPLPGEEPPLA
ncbi:MAG: MMPL family transporter [Planctomycetes bacterium]|nr:MMPL family transporter [Planctomycetota bacterium]